VGCLLKFIGTNQHVLEKRVSEEEQKRGKEKMQKRIIDEINKRYKNDVIRKSSLINFLKSLDLRSEPTKIEKYLIYKELKNALQN